MFGSYVMGDIPTYIRPVNIFSTQILSRRTTPYIGTIFAWGFLIWNQHPLTLSPFSVLFAGDHTCSQQKSEASLLVCHEYGHRLHWGEMANRRRSMKTPRVLFFKTKILSNVYIQPFNYDRPANWYSSLLKVLLLHLRLGPDLHLSAAYPLLRASASRYIHDLYLLLAARSVGQMNICKFLLTLALALGLLRVHLGNPCSQSLFL